MRERGSGIDLAEGMSEKGENDASYMRAGNGMQMKSGVG